MAGLLHNSGLYGAGPSTDNAIVRHPIYFFEDGNLFVKAENVLFNIHRSVLSANATLLDERVPRSAGQSESYPFDLKGVNPQGFVKFMSLIYRVRDIEPFTVEDWISILDQSQAWGCTQICDTAVAELQSLPMDDVLKIATWRRYGLDKDQVARCYHTLGIRPWPLSVKEAELLGMDMAVKVAGLRDSVHKSVLKYFRECIGGNMDGVTPLEHVKDLVCRALLAEFMQDI